jgi:hypothetical protein
MFSCIILTAYSNVFPPSCTALDGSCRMRQDNKCVLQCCFNLLEKFSSRYKKLGQKSTGNTWAGLAFSVAGARLLALKPRTTPIVITHMGGQDA